MSARQFSRVASASVVLSMIAPPSNPVLGRYRAVEVSKLGVLARWPAARITLRQGIRVHDTVSPPRQWYEIPAAALMRCECWPWLNAAPAALVSCARGVSNRVNQAAGVLSHGRD